MTLPPKYVALNDRITSLQNPRIKSAMRLHSSRGRKQQDRMIIFGLREVQRAANARIKLQEIFVAESQINEGPIGQLIESTTGTLLIQVTDEIIQKLSYGDRCDGIVAVASRPETSLERFPVEANSIVLVLEAIEKPGNLGAVIRSIDATGASGLIVADTITDPFHPNAIRASTGAVFKTPIACGSCDDVQAWLRDNAYQVMPAIVDSSKSLFDLKLTEPRIAFVLGNEALGLSDLWRGNDSIPVRLPMHGIADSLNVSVTAAVMLFEATRQRSSQQREA